MTRSIVALSLAAGLCGVSVAPANADRGGGFHGGGFHGGFFHGGFHNGFHGGCCFRGGFWWPGVAFGLGLGAIAAAPYYYAPPTIRLSTTRRHRRIISRHLKATVRRRAAAVRVAMRALMFARWIVQSPQVQTATARAIAVRGCRVGRTDRRGLAARVQTKTSRTRRPALAYRASLASEFSACPFSSWMVMCSNLPTSNRVSDWPVSRDYGALY